MTKIISTDVQVQDVLGTGVITVGLHQEGKSGLRRVVLGLRDSAGFNVTLTLRPVEVELLIETIRDMHNKQQRQKTFL